MKVLATSDLFRVESTPRAMFHGKSTERLTAGESITERLVKEGKQFEDALRDDVQDAVETINNAIEHVNRALRFSIHEDTQQIMVKVVDVSTDEVIKEIPPEDVLDTVARIREMIGLLIDERA
ncbi:MAG: flagellar protein FlaG [Firmicutes bacterium]|jgi:flagellar protein FlaG|nr:flagellar protein FlaG [Bacillota bacterium]